MAELLEGRPIIVRGFNMREIDVHDPREVNCHYEGEEFGESDFDMVVIPLGEGQMSETKAFRMLVIKAIEIYEAGQTDI